MVGDSELHSLVLMGVIRDFLVLTFTIVGNF